MSALASRRTEYEGESSSWHSHERGLNEDTVVTVGSGVAAESAVAEPGMTVATVRAACLALAFALDLPRHRDAYLRTSALDFGACSLGVSLLSLPFFTSPVPLSASA